MSSFKHYVLNWIYFVHFIASYLSTMIFAPSLSDPPPLFLLQPLPLLLLLSVSLFSLITYTIVSLSPSNIKFSPFLLSFLFLKCCSACLGQSIKFVNLAVRWSTMCMVTKLLICGKQPLRKAFFNCFYYICAFFYTEISFKTKLFSHLSKYLILSGLCWNMYLTFPLNSLLALKQVFPIFLNFFLNLFSSQPVWIRATGLVSETLLLLLPSSFHRQLIRYHRKVTLQQLFHWHTSEYLPPNTVYTYITFKCKQTNKQNWIYSSRVPHHDFP